MMIPCVLMSTVQVGVQSAYPKNFIFVSNWGVIHFAIIYIEKHSLEKLAGANLPHYAFLYIFQFFICALHCFNTCMCTKRPQNN